MKKFTYVFLLMLLILSFSLKSEEIKYTQEDADKACGYLGGFCEIAKEKCQLTKSEDSIACLMDYATKAYRMESVGQDPADIRNEKYAKEACNKLDKECAFVQLECLTTSSFYNSCISITYYKMEVAKERCGIMGYKACLEEEREYGVKILHELTLPNVGKPINSLMDQKCKNVGQYKVTSEELRRYYYGYIDAFQYMDMPDVQESKEYQYTINKELYGCMKAVLDKEKS